MTCGRGGRAGIGRGTPPSGSLGSSVNKGNLSSPRRNLSLLEMVVQRLGLDTPTAGGTGSIPGRGTDIPNASGFFKKPNRRGACGAGPAARRPRQSGAGTHLHRHELAQEAHAELLHGGAHLLGHLLVEAPQEHRAHHDCDLQAQAGQEARTLQRHVGRTHHQGCARAVGQREQVVAAERRGSMWDSAGARASGHWGERLSGIAGVSTSEEYVQPGDWKSNGGPRAKPALGVHLNSHTVKSVFLKVRLVEKVCQSLSCFKHRGHRSS